MTKASPVEASVLRFGRFQIDVNAGELRRAGRIVRLQPQPLRMLTLLVRHAGELVTREAVREQLWGDETFVDFEQGQNHCMRQIRTALGDDARKPRYVETLPRRGYRFIARVESGVASDPPLHDASEANAEPLADFTNLPSPAVAALAPATEAIPASNGARGPRRWALFTTAATIACAIAVGQTDKDPAVAPLALRPRVAVVRFADASPDGVLGRALTHELTAAFSRQPAPVEFVPTLGSRGSRGTNDTVPELARTMGVDYLLGGTVARDDGRFHVTVRLIEAEGLTPLWTHEYERAAEGNAATAQELARTIVTETLRRLQL